MVPLSKSGVRKHRGFESRPLRQSSSPEPAGACRSARFLLRERSPSGLWRRTGNAVRGNPSRVRIPPSPPNLAPIGSVAGPSGSPARRNARTSARRWAGVATSGVAKSRCGLHGCRGSVLAGTRQSSARPGARASGRALGRRPRAPGRPGEPTVKASLLDCAGRARRGTSGALNLQSAPAGLNSHPRTASLQAAASSDVEDRVPRSDEPRTVSGPEGSSTKRSSSGAAERPGPSRSSWRA